VELQSLLSAGHAVKEAVQQAHQRAAHHGNGYTFRQLTRLNIPTDDANTAQAACSNSGVVSTYDLIAVQPQSERAFAQACTTLDVDIISLDLAKRLPYRFKPASVQAAAARGVHFEITYSAALRDSGTRKQLFTNAQALCRETRGRNVIVSSGARTAMELRGPLDVINLATFLGMTQQQAVNALTTNAGAVLDHMRARKAYRGALFLRLRPLDEASRGPQEEGPPARHSTSFARMHAPSGAAGGADVEMTPAGPV
jgi:ribonuclease P/MRP protein subunit RPP1